MDNFMVVELHTVESFAKARNLSRQSAINKLSQLKKNNLITTSGGGTQKRLYKVSSKPQVQDNGMYSILNKYASEKLVPKFTHRVYGKYSVEQAIIDAIQIGDVRTLQAAKHLFNHVTNWKLLFTLAKKNAYVKQIYTLYDQARNEMRVRRMPARYSQ
jgi:hypothetical protein